VVRAHFAHADVLAVPSRYEELGSVLVEAMHAGLPAVAAAVGGISEVVADGVTGRLVPPGDSRALAAALDAVLGDPGTARRMATAAQARAAAYHWDALAARVHAVYDSVSAPAHGSVAAVPAPHRSPPAGRGPRTSA
jgi:2-deoxystreptamine N-acetyl-D-glucosaminyltransferase/2-deoxystreptamine glucosyltransferase